MTRWLILVLTVLSLAVAGPAHAGQRFICQPWINQTVCESDAPSGGHYIDTRPFGPDAWETGYQMGRFFRGTPSEPVYVPVPTPVYMPYPVYVPVAPVAPPAPTGPYVGTYWTNPALGTWSGCRPGDTLVVEVGQRFCR